MGPEQTRLKCLELVVGLYAKIPLPAGHIYDMDLVIDDARKMSAFVDGKDGVEVVESLRKQAFG